MPHRIVSGTHGILGNVIIAESVIGSTLPEVEMWLRIGLLVIGIISGVYTIRFYRSRTRIMLEAEVKQKRQ